MRTLSQAAVLALALGLVSCQSEEPISSVRATETVASRRPDPIGPTRADAGPWHHFVLNVDTDFLVRASRRRQTIALVLQNCTTAAFVRHEAPFIDGTSLYQFGTLFDRDARKLVDFDSEETQIDIFISKHDAERNDGRLCARVEDNTRTYGPILELNPEAGNGFR